MARKKVIKEVEVKFSPAFDKAINGLTKPKKAKKPAKAKVKTAGPKATAKPRKPRGYTCTLVERILTVDGVRKPYKLYEVAGPKMDKPKYFVTEEYAKTYIANNEVEAVIKTALSGKGYQHIKGVISAHKDLLDAAELPELDTELPEKCDKTSIEDTDA